MNSNFNFITDERLLDIKNACIEAENTLEITPATSAAMSRKALELGIKWIYGIDGSLEIPYQQTLATLIHDRNFREIVDQNLFFKLIYIQKLGNQAIHSTTKIKREEALLSLRNLHDFMQWLTYLYSNEYKEHEFKEDYICYVDENKEKEKEKLELLKRLENSEKTIEELQKKFEEIRNEITKNRKEKQKTIPTKITDLSEFKTRKKYIDLDLKIAGWEFNNNIVEEMPVTGMPTESGNGFVDYVLLGANGKPLAVVEAKRTSRDARVGQQQAKLYADCLEQKYNQRPIIFFSNGFETYMWDDTYYPYRKVSGFYTQDELQLLIDRRSTRKELSNISINDNITNRTYQQEAIKAYCNELNEHRRKGLLVMATGTGKTRTAISIVDVLTKNNWVKNVLFLADRVELVKQAKNNFNKLMPYLSTINLSTEKDNAENARMVFSTYQTMMNSIDEIKNKDGKKLFTIGHFDLIIIDEAHRSIYKKYQAIFDYFDGFLLGLTATPRSEIDKNTYKIFELPDNVPTYSYEYKEAVESGFLVDYHTIECSTQFIREGIKYSELSNEDKEQFEETFAGDDTIIDNVSSNAINSWLFNQNTVDQVLELLMDKGLKVESNDKLGKTIIFAKNHKHACYIEERFNELYPKYSGQFARVIDIHTEHHDSLIDDFSNISKMPQIAISVDMLDTGIDIPEIVNLVFFKDVKSKVKFLQMIGRGTRLCPDLFGLGKDKKEFYIFDVCKNFEFFEQNPKGKEVTTGMSLSQFLFGLKIDILNALEKTNELTDEGYVEYKNMLLESLANTVASFNQLKFDVRQQLKYVEKYKEPSNWTNLTDIEALEIKNNLSLLVMSEDSDECAKQFDKLMLSIILSKLLNIKIDREIKRVEYIANELRKQGPAVLGNKIDDINKILSEKYIENCNIYEIEKIRQSLRDLIKLLDKRVRKYYFTNFDDQINIVEEEQKIIDEFQFSDYKKKVDFYLKNNLDNAIINKIRNNEEISENEINLLQQIIFNDINSNQNEFNSNFNNQSLVLLVRKTVGMSKETLDREFAKYINENELNLHQTRFINLLKNYIMKNGVIDKKILNEDPFTNYGSLTQIFDGRLDILKLIVMIIDIINGNGCYVQE